MVDISTVKARSNVTAVRFRASESSSISEARRRLSAMPDRYAPDSTLDLDEAVLAERARARDPEAWTAIYERHYQPIFRYVHARVFDRETSLDLTSAVFVSAINGITGYRYTGRPILAWLYRIARNTVADHQRRALGRRGIDKVGASLRAVADVFRGHETGISVEPASSVPDEMAERLDLHRAVAQLPESQREVLILRFLVGLSTDEIADLIGKEKAAVYSLHARAITSLRQSLGGSAAPARSTLRVADENPRVKPIDLVGGKGS
jgi:RNA polymerase sigma-70 factor (ECF subfamily)